MLMLCLPDICLAWRLTVTDAALTMSKSRSITSPNARTGIRKATHVLECESLGFVFEFGSFRT